MKLAKSTTKNRATHAYASDNGTMVDFLCGGTAGPLQPRGFESQAGVETWVGKSDELTCKGCIAWLVKKNAYALQAGPPDYEDAQYQDDTEAEAAEMFSMYGFYGGGW